MNKHKSRWKDFWDAILAMLPGDPPLRWTVDASEHRSLMVQANAWMHQQHIRIKLVYHQGEIWVIRLTDPKP